MAASLEYQLISKIVELQDFHTIEQLKITDDFFFSPECRTIFSYIQQHFQNPATFNCVPSFQLVQQIFPGFQFVPSYDDILTLSDQIRQSKMRVELLSVAESLSERAEYNPKEALAILREATATLCSRHEPSNDLLLEDAYDELMSDYENVATNRGITGLPWPWQPLNEATQGIHPGEFIVIYGRPKNMKTWLALYIVTVINMYANARVLVYSLEMHPKQIVRRTAAIRSAVNYDSLMGAKLQPADRQRFFDGLKFLKDNARSNDPNAVRVPSFMVASGRGGKGIGYLHSKIREFRPNIVLVDGMYLMQDDRQQKRTIDWKAIAHISQDLKNTASEFGIPLIATAQANRKADKNVKNADLSEIAYTDAIGQDTDFSIRVQKRIDKSSREPELILGFPGSREVDLDSMLIHAIPATNFQLKSMHVQQSDDDDKDNGGHRGGKKDNSHTAPPRISMFGGGMPAGNRTI